MTMKAVETLGMHVGVLKHVNMQAIRNITAQGYVNVYESVKPQANSLLPFISDQLLSLISPIILYWVYSIFFHILDEFDLMSHYRLHTPAELAARNKATRYEVVRDVLIQQSIQTTAGLMHFAISPVDSSHQYSLSFTNMKDVIQILARLFVAFLFMDSWQYWLHRIMHRNSYLYKTFHSRHHRLYVPYAFGALYNHPLEGLLMDTLGAIFGSVVAGLDTRVELIFFTFSTIKTVDDHCGYKFPWDPLQFLFSNNSLYHDIHHQSFGTKHNFSQPFFTFWDKITNTHMSIESVQHHYAKAEKKYSKKDRTIKAHTKKE